MFCDVALRRDAISACDTRTDVCAPVGACVCVAHSLAGVLAGRLGDPDGLDIRTEALDGYWGTRPGHKR